MILAKGISGACLGPVVVSIGNFDGVHLGHQSMLETLKKHSVRMNLPSCVVIFEPQPLEYFKKDHAPLRLMTLREKVGVVKTLGIERVLVLPFNKDLASLAPEAFIEKVLIQRLNAKLVLVGQDFRFGQHRAGDVTLLKEAEGKHGYHTDVFDIQCLDEEKISSTDIREALKAENLDLMAQALGRPYSITGRVIRGAQRGREIGVPTANIAISHRKLPLHGVYVVRVTCDEGKVYNGVANIGVRPTVDGETHYLEVHIFDFNQCLYQQYIEVTFYEKLRNEQKFDSLEALIRQINLDIAQAKKRHCGYD